MLHLLLDILWYKTGDYPRLLVVDYISESWVAEATANWSGIQKALYWILHRTIPLLFAALALVMVMFFIIMTYAPKFFIDETFNKEQNVVKRLRKREKAERIEKLTKL